MGSDRTVTLSAPYPLLDPGEYVADCFEATCAWARQWKKWMARLKLSPQNYSGRPYRGDLCKFFSLGSEQSGPRAGNHSGFRALWVEANGAQPNAPEGSLSVFVGLRYSITVETVTKDRKGNERRPEHWYSIVREIHVIGRTPQHSNNEPLNLSTQRTRKTSVTEQHSNTHNTPPTEIELLARKMDLNSALGGAQ